VTPSDAGASKDDGRVPTCSRAGCRAAATWQIQWRNPRIHAEDRRKTWVACDEHVDFLREFLASRDFPVAVSSLSEKGM
jgi:hypothetical protein